MEEQLNVFLKWNNYQDALLSVFSSLFHNGSLVDCTVSAEGQYLKAHKVILSACSPYFESLFSQHYDKYPIIILPDVKYEILKIVIEFVYSGEVSVPQNELSSVLKLAEILKIKGIYDKNHAENVEERLKIKNKLKIPTEQAVVQTKLASYDEICRESLHLDTQVGENASVRIKIKSEPVIPVEQAVALRELVSHDEKCRETPCLDTQLRENAPIPSLQKENDTEMPILSTAVHKSSEDICHCIDSKSSIVKLAAYENTDEPDGLSLLQSPVHTRLIPCTSTLVPELHCSSVSNIAEKSILSVCTETDSKSHILSRNLLSPQSCSLTVSGTQCEQMTGEKPALKGFSEITPINFNDVVEEITIDDEIDYNLIDDDVHEVTTVITEHCVDGKALCTRPQVCHFKKKMQPFQKYKCNFCGRHYRYYTSFKRHEKYECGKGPRFLCTYCHRRFSQKTSLMQHTAKLHHQCFN